MENKRFVNAPEVMYKGYCVANRQWAHGYLVPPHNIYFEVMMPSGELEGWDMNVEPESLAMSTGRYDKDGEPIFGGDILYITHGSEAGDVQSAYSFLWDTKLCEWSLFRIDGESFIYVGNIAFKQERVINSGVTLYERSLK